MATTKTRRCIGSTRFGIEPHEAPVRSFPKQPSQPDGLGRMCAEHWKLYVKGLAADRKVKASVEAPARGPQHDGVPEYATDDEVAVAKSARRQATKTATATTKRARRRTPMADKPEPKPASGRVREARELLAATETLGGKAYTDAFGSDEVQAALEVVDGHGTGEPDDGQVLVAGVRFDSETLEEAEPVDETEEADAA